MASRPTALSNSTTGPRAFGSTLNVTISFLALSLLGLLEDVYNGTQERHSNATAAPFLPSFPKAVRGTCFSAFSSSGGKHQYLPQS